MNTWKLKNTHSGEMITITKSVFKVGRNLNADLVSETNVLSRNHATLSLLIDGLYVQDNNSLNGTFLNDKKIQPMELTKVEKGDVLGFGCGSHLITKTSATTPFIFEIILEEPIEERYLNSTKTEAQTFCTINKNDFVVISDDDDDDPISCSQIFHITEKIKKEQSLFTDGFDPYCEIKEELRNLDYCVKEIEVDLTEEVQACQNTMELLNVLESSTEETSSKEQQEKDITEDVTKKSTTGTPELRVVIPKEDQLKKIHPVIEISDDEIEIINTRSKEIGKSSEKKHNAPPIIEPHRMQNKTPEKPKNTSKRKNTKVLSPAKKLKTSKTPPVKKSDKEALAEERKLKLKKITRRSTGQTDTTKSLNTQSKVVISDSRENSILEQVSKSSTSSRRSQTLNNNRKLQDATVSSKPNYNDVRNQDTNCSTTRYNSPKSTTIIVDKKESILKSNFHDFLSPQTSAPNRNRNDCDNIDNQVNQIVQWPVQWLEEQSNTDLSPPVSGDIKPSPVPNVFNNFSDYINIMIPLVFLEMWQFIFQSACNKEDARPPMIVNIVHERRIDKICYLDCEYFLDENNPKTVIRPEDLAIVEMKVKDSRNSYKFAGFGIIKNCGRLNRRECFKSDCNFGFTIVIGNLQGKQTFDTKLLMQVITSVSSSLRLLRTIKYLEKSVICNNVLNPNINNLNISSEGSIISGMRVNEEQKYITVEASNFCLGNEPGMYLIRGPPGTGKSTVIMNIIFEILFKSQKYGHHPLILVTAPSNAAIDCLIMKLAEYRSKLIESHRRCLKLIRMGPEASISKNVDKFKLSYFAQKEVLVQSRLQHSEKFKKWTEDGRDDLDMFLKNQLKHEYYYRLRNAEEKILLGSNVICTTLNSSVCFRLRQSTRKGQLKFTCCIIDEASQCTELESLLPLQLCIEKFVLVGDPQQLPAVVCNKDAQKLGFGNSLFSRINSCLKNKDCSQIRMLFTQYRMKPEICEYPNKKFYEGKLRSLPICNNVLEPTVKPYLLFNLKTENDDMSEYVNKDEVTLISMVLKNLHNTVKTKRYTIGIITPYKAQKELLRKSISNIKFGTGVLVSVNTVDSFQGMENDIIIISCVRYNPNSFLQNEQRLNVALTRAKQALYVIGNYSLFKQSRPLYDLREDAKKRKLCFDIDIKKIKSLHKLIFS